MCGKEAPEKGRAHIVYGDEEHFRTCLPVSTVRRLLGFDDAKRVTQEESRRVTRAMTKARALAEMLVMRAERVNLERFDPDLHHAIQKVKEALE